MKKIFLLIFIFQSANALQTRMLSNIKATGAKKKAIVEVIPQEDEFIHQNGMIISCSNPAISIKNWCILEEPETKYLPTFKKEKRGFNTSFTLEIIFKKNDKLKKEDLKQTTLHVSCFVTNANNNTQVVHNVVK